ncbi:hypothetical protein BCY86_03915 [Pajaroellobacter abortibovis]|uniref:Uncharacterized protein n=1 Tax=Pajaroellobacter abortibovis TaxID=1882918 RepID=A0A1L6MWI5_9BACT|nr:hypothetical protein BCY86_03915 [Pajaroellobacter abortibovis]
MIGFISQSAHHIISQACCFAPKAQSPFQDSTSKPCAAEIDQAIHVLDQSVAHFLLSNSPHPPSDVSSLPSLPTVPPSLHRSCSQSVADQKALAAVLRIYETETRFLNRRTKQTVAARKTIAEMLSTSIDKLPKRD